MPLYEYQCLDCATWDKRIAGLDDHAALCIRCGGVMLRRDEDIFLAYFDGNDSRPRPEVLKLEDGFNHQNNKFRRVQ